MWSRVQNRQFKSTILREFSLVIIIQEGVYVSIVTIVTLLFVPVVQVILPNLTLPKESHIVRLCDFKTYEYEIANFFLPHCIRANQPDLGTHQYNQ